MAGARAHAAGTMAWAKARVERGAWPWQDRWRAGPDKVYRAVCLTMQRRSLPGRCLGRDGCDGGPVEPTLYRPARSLPQPHPAQRDRADRATGSQGDGGSQAAGQQHWQRLPEDWPMQVPFQPI